MERITCSCNNAVHIKEEFGRDFNQQVWIKAEVSAEVEHIKEEVDWDAYNAKQPELCKVKEEVASYDNGEYKDNFHHDVKQEAYYGNYEHTYVDRDVTEGREGMVRDLYAGHLIKDELVVGPECLQPRDVAFTLHAQRAIQQPELRNYVVPERSEGLETLVTSSATCPSDRHPDTPRYASNQNGVDHRATSYVCDGARLTEHSYYRHQNSGKATCSNDRHPGTPRYASANQNGVDHRATSYVCDGARLTEHSYYRHQNSEEEEIDVVSPCPLPWQPQPSATRSGRQLRPPAALAYNNPAVASESDTNLHKLNERHRRKSLKKLYEELRAMIPSLRSKPNASKVEILREAAILCRRLRAEEMERQQLQSQTEASYRKLQMLRALYNARQSIFYRRNNP